MSFAYSSGVITQTGTDTSLAGLAGLTDVTVTTIAGISYYTVASTSRLLVNGVLTINPEVECLVLLRSPSGSTNAALWDAGGTGYEANLEVRNAGAILNIGARTLTNGVYKYKRGTAIRMPNGTMPFSSMNGLSNLSGGVINWYSGVIESANTIGCRAGCPFNIYSKDACRFLNLRTNEALQVRNGGNSADMVIYGLAYDGLDATQPGRLFSTYGYDTLQGVNFVNGQIQQRTGAAGPLVVNGFSVGANSASQDVSVIGVASSWALSTVNVQPIDIYNSDIGDAVAIDTTPAGDTTKRGVVTVWQQIGITLRDSLGAVNGAYVVIPTTSRAGRREPTGAGNPGMYQSRNFASTAYDEFAATSAASGVVPTLSVLLRAWGVDTTGFFDYYYSKTGTAGVNDFDVYYYSYLHLLSSQEVTLASAAPIALSRTLLRDSYITQTNAATVAAYTDIEDLDKLYDYLKWWSVQPANTSTPTRDTYLMTVDGTNLDLSDWEVILTPAASGPFINKTLKQINLKATKLDSGFNFKSFACKNVTFNSGAAPGSAFYSTDSGSSGVLTISNLQDGSTILVVDGAGTTVAFVAAHSGTTYSLPFPPGSTGTWSWAAKKAGWRSASGTFDASFGGPVNAVAVQPKKLQSDGSDMYQASADSALVTVNIGSTTSYIDIGNGTVNAQVAFDMVERAMETETGLRWVISGNEGITISLDIRGNTMNLTGGWLVRRRSAVDINATLAAYVLSTEGAVADESNGPVKFLSVDNRADIAQAVYDKMFVKLQSHITAMGSK